jgi:hypothetical protein
MTVETTTDEAEKHGGAAEEQLVWGLRTDPDAWHISRQPRPPWGQRRYDTYPIWTRQLRGEGAVTGVWVAGHLLRLTSESYTRTNTLRTSRAQNAAWPRSLDAT